MSVALPSLIIYIILINPAIYSLFHHGRKGILGWYLLAVFCALRIAGAALQMHIDATGSKSMGAAIVSSIGLSPLLLATESILHEARTARDPAFNHRLELIKILNFHGIVVAGLVLVMIGVMNEMKMDVPVPNTMMKVGVILLASAWFFLVIWALHSLKQPQQDRMAVPAFDDATLLIWGIITALPFIGCRALYALLSTFVQSASFRDSQAVKAAMSTAPEIVTVIVLVYMGVKTKDMSKLRKMNKEQYIAALG